MIQPLGLWLERGRCNRDTYVPRLKDCKETKRNRAKWERRGRVGCKWRDLEWLYLGKISVN